MHTKFIFITGGVCSSLGKGLTSASIGLLLERLGLKVALLKLDPYLNVDPGTMNPYQHGEVYVTDDGAETDLDLGHYFRFTNSPLSKASNTTSGQIYNTVIHRERRGDYLGKTVQVIPHITDEIKQRINNCAKQEKDIDVVLIEIGGTVGDIESLPFLEAIRQFRHEHIGKCLNLHLTYVPYIKAAGEFKSKPSQHSVQELSRLGLFPEIMLCRCEHSLPEEIKEKISLFCNVRLDAVIEEVDVMNSIYEVPLDLHRQNIVPLICEMLNIPLKAIDLADWQQLVEKIKNPKGTVSIGIVGKYLDHQDAYKSVYEALHHGALAHGWQVKIIPIEADKVSEAQSPQNVLLDCDGYLVPGGFGERGWKGKILAAKHCREKQIPYFGICLGMQVLAVEFAKHVMEWEDANSTEINPETKTPIVSLLSEQKQVSDVGGTMRLGNNVAIVKPHTKLFETYQSEKIYERHRHRYEFNNRYLPEMTEKGFRVSATHEDSALCEAAEIADHPWMVGVQFHPEFKSKPTDAHPLFREFIKAAIANKEKNAR